MYPRALFACYNVSMLIKLCKLNGVIVFPNLFWLLIVYGKEVC